MGIPRRVRIAATVSVGCLALVGCNGTDQSRQAAGIGSWAACAAGLAQACVVSVPERSTIVVNNGTTVVFADQGKPVTGLAATRMCWTGEDDVDAATCADGSALPEWLLVETTSVSASGTSWPALSIRILETSDGQGETFVPLPALIDVAVEGSSGGTTVSLEVACCDLIETPSASTDQPGVLSSAQEEGASA